MPRPYSALSSKRLLPHAGPWPSALVVYGVDGTLSAHTQERPVALAIIMRSPKSWVTSLAYGVSPRPAQAPENSSNGCSNWSAFDGKLVHRVGFPADAHSIIPKRSFLFLSAERFHDQGLFFCRAYLGTAATAEAVHDGYLHGEIHVFHAYSWFSLEPFGLNQPVLHPLSGPDG